MYTSASCQSLPIHLVKTRSRGHQKRLLQRFLKLKLKKVTHLSNSGGWRVLKVSKDLSEDKVWMVMQVKWLLTCISHPWGHFLSWSCNTFRCQLELPARFIKPSSVTCESCQQMIWYARLPFVTITWCITLNNDEQLICWLFQKHSLIIASWKPSSQELYAK